MAAKKTTFKGFTFKRPGGNNNDSSTPPPTNRSSSPLLLQQRSFEKKTSLSEHGHLKRSNSGQSGGLQTSIASFTKKKIAVAAVLPHRSSTPVCATRPQDRLTKTISPIQSSMVPIEILDDDDDFELFSASQNFSFSSKESKRKTPQKRSHSKDNETSKMSSFTKRQDAEKDPDIIYETPEKIKPGTIVESESEDEVRRPSKKRRVTQIFDSDGEEEETSHKPHVKAKKRPSTKLSQDHYDSSTSRSEDEEDISRHPLLKRKVMTNVNGDDLQTFKDILMGIADEACDIFCKIRTCDLMNWLSSDFERLQKLLAVRKKIKDFRLFDVKAEAFRQRKKDTVPKSSLLSSSTPSNIQKVMKSPQVLKCETDFMRQSHSNTMSPVERIKELGMKKKPTPERFPCGDSFFENTNIAKNSRLSTNRNSLDSEFLSFNKASPFGDMTASDGSFDCGQKTKNMPSMYRAEISSQNSSIAESNQRGAGNSQQTVQHENNSWIDEDDNFSDELEAAMELESNLYDNLPAFSKNAQSSSTKKVTGQSTSSGHEFTKNVIPNSPMKKMSYSAENGCATSSVTVRDNDIDDWPNDSDTLNGSDEDADKEYAYIPQFSSSDHDDGASPEFAGMEFEHSPQLLNLFRQVFGLSEFRHNQLEAINAALLGHDCFILMPTGGGKSLCYQLPAVTTNGVSIIISPLKALIQDQTTRLLSLDIPATYLSSDIDTTQSQSIYSGLYQRCPAFKMLYVTPEKLSASEKLLSCLDNLFKRSLLTRFVIDEAHCVSQWGHDFRPDYKRLNVLRQRFPGVPMMALTATATPRVRKDIIHQLGMLNPKWFMQSFNRPNLKYTVQPKKPSNATTDVIEMIKTRFRNECGIVYCLSRKECDSLAASLKKAGLSAEPYHAGLNDKTRSSVQEKWLNDDRCKIMCATIAFGMGIDKADVRFVIHYSLPKSVEGFYQEAGRAGRDGQLSYCTLLYNYSDVKRLRRMIEMDHNATFESKRVHNDNLYRMVNYCENVTDCRRCQILQYFGEVSFDRSMCDYLKGASCDNCLTKGSFNIRDVTQDAKEIVKCVKEINSSYGAAGNHTLIHLLEIFKGSLNSKIQNLGHSKLALHGRGKTWTRQDAERFCRKLVIDGILKEDLRVTAQDFAVCYIKLGPNAFNLMQNKIKVDMPIQGGRQRVDVAKIGSEKKSDRQKVEMDCLMELRVMAKAIAAEYNVKNYALIFPESALKQLAQRTPITRQEMIDHIDHFNTVIIDKYKADRLLEITLKYSFKMPAMSEDESDGEYNGSNGQFESDMDSASRYFEEPSTSQRGSGRGRGRGFKRRGARSKRGKSRGKRSTRGAKSTTTKQLSQFKFNSTSTRGGKSAAAKRPTSVNRTTLGLMPDPRSRPFLASIGSFMG